MTIEIKKTDGKISVTLYRSFELMRDMYDTYTVIEPMSGEEVYRGDFDGMIDFLVDRLREDRMPMAKMGFVFTDKGEWASPDRASKVKGNIIPLEKYLEIIKEAWKEQLKPILMDRGWSTIRWVVI